MEQQAIQFNKSKDLRFFVQFFLSDLLFLEL